MAACVAALATPALASAVDTTLRVEGINDTIIPESGVQIEGTGTATVYDGVGTPATVGRGSAFWQILRASSGSGVDFRFTYYPSLSGFFITRIGPDEPGAADWWQYRVNHADPDLGANQVDLGDGDSVVWFTGNGTGTHTLEATPSSDRLAKGDSFTVKVTAYDAAGTASPAAGAAVSYGALRATTDARGQTTFIAPGDGTQGVRATRAGDVRSATRGVCTYDGDPTICNVAALPAPPTAPAPAPGGASLVTDTVAPGSAITKPVLRSRRTTVRNIAGTAGPDRTDVAKVEVSLGLRVGTQCRFRTASGRLTAARPCARPQWVTARTAGTRWLLPLRGKKLPTGTWRVESRATDGAGNVETTRIPGVNIGAFTVRGHVVKPVSRITAPTAGARRAAVTGLRGTAGPAAADIQLVEVAVARRTAAGCRFLTAKGTFTGPRPCAKRVFLPADSRGARWMLAFDEPLAGGRWIAWTRATSAAGTHGTIRGTRFTVGTAAR